MKLILGFKFNKFEEIISGLTDKIKLYDSCMGTGEWLVLTFNMLQEKYGSRILLSGGDVSPTTFQYGLMNLILTLKHFPHDMYCESSLTHVNDLKHNFILTNPPFQTGKNFKQIIDNFKNDRYTNDNNVGINEIYKLKNNSPPMQFMELNLYKLEENGLCIIVLPYGDLFSGKSHKKSREHFMNICNITDIILMPSGIFTHTGIKTCCLIFQKNGCTKEICFSEAVNDCSEINLITSVRIEDIKKENKCSWFYQDYLIEEENVENENLRFVEFGKVFDLEKGKLQSSKIVEDVNGTSVFINLSKNKEFKKIKDYINNGENIFISNTSPLGLIQYYNGKCTHSDLLYNIKLKENYKDKINIKFYYYYLKSIKEHIEKTYQKGACNKSLDKDNFNRMKIPVPKIEIQNEFVNKLDILYNHHTTNIKMINEYEEIKKIILWSFIKNIKEFKRLGEICEFKNGKNITRDKLIDGEYLVVGGGKTPLGKHNEYNINENTIIISKDGAYAGYISMYDTKIFLSNHGIYISDLQDIVIPKYVYYNMKLHLQNKLYSLQKGAAQPGINKKDLENINIQIPSLEIQEQIVNELNYYDTMINNLKQENIKIENNKILELILDPNIDFDIIENDETEILIENDILENEFIDSDNESINENIIYT